MTKLGRTEKLCRFPEAGAAGTPSGDGIAEVPLGTPLRDVIGLGGRMPANRSIKAVLVGGPSGSLVPPRLLGEPLVPGGPVNPGTGGITALDERASLRDVVGTLLDFNARESCGKCTPCREGTARLRELLNGRQPVAGDAVTELAEVVRLASLCGLGQAAPLSILSGFRDFPSAFLDPNLKA